MGNYRDFGDTKKVPGLPQDKFAALVRASRAYETDSKTLERLLDGCLARLYTLNDSVAQLGLGDKVSSFGKDRWRVVKAVGRGMVKTWIDVEGRRGQREIIRGGIAASMHCSFLDLCI